MVSNDAIVNDLNTKHMKDRHPVLALDDIPVIAVGSMNDTHHEEVALVNTLGDLLRQADAGETDEVAISSALQQWLEHTEQHFAGENELMQKYGFPPYSIHAQEHASALENLRHTIDDWNADHSIEALSEYVFSTWPQWFNQHVSSMDFVTAQFLSSFVD